jgi:hypothetical protein
MLLLLLLLVGPLPPIKRWRSSIGQESRQIPHVKNVVGRRADSSLEDDDAEKAEEKDEDVEALAHALLSTLHPNSSARRTAATKIEAGRKKGPVAVVGDVVEAVAVVFAVGEVVREVVDWPQPPPPPSSTPSSTPSPLANRRRVENDTAT